MKTTMKKAAVLTALVLVSASAFGQRLFDSQNCASSSYGHFRAHVHR